MAGPPGRAGGEPEGARDGRARGSDGWPGCGETPARTDAVIPGGRSGLLLGVLVLLLIAAVGGGFLFLEQRSEQARARGLQLDRFNAELDAAREQANLELARRQRPGSR